MGQSVRSVPISPTGTDCDKDPCGSSTGSAVGVSAGYAPLALGTETCGSLVMPGARAGLYAFKPALGAVDMDGVYQTSMSLDVVGGLAKSVADLALLTEAALTDAERRLLPHDGYRSYLNKTFDALRIGFVDPKVWSFHPDVVHLDDRILREMVLLVHVCDR